MLQLISNPVKNVDIKTNIGSFGNTKGEGLGERKKNFTICTKEIFGKLLKMRNLYKTTCIENLFALCYFFLTDLCRYNPDNSYS